MSGSEDRASTIPTVFEYGSTGSNCYDIDQFKMLPSTSYDYDLHQLHHTCMNNNTLFKWIEQLCVYTFLTNLL